jgi:hypothetical protein
MCGFETLTVDVAAHQTYPSWFAIKNHHYGKIAFGPSAWNPSSFRAQTYTTLETKVQQLPIKVRRATVRV